MKVTITPGKLSGTIQVPPSKSQAHRLIIGRSPGRRHQPHPQPGSLPGHLRHPGLHDPAGRGGVPGGRDRDRASAAADPAPASSRRWTAASPGSTIRFLMPVRLAVAGGGVFRGRGRLMERPYKPYEDIFTRQNITFTRQPGQITLSGTLKPGRFELPGTSPPSSSLDCSTRCRCWKGIRNWF